jgi:hypothetical protein
MDTVRLLRWARKDVPQGLKPNSFQSFMARLKSCPDTKLMAKAVRLVRGCCTGWGRCRSLRFAIPGFLLRQVALALPQFVQPVR